MKCGNYMTDKNSEYSQLTSTSDIPYSSEDTPSLGHDYNLVTHPNNTSTDTNDEHNRRICNKLHVRNVQILGCFNVRKSKCSLIAGFLILACLVNMQTMSNTGSYLVSYMIKYAPGGERMDESNILWIGSWYSLASGISSAIGGYLEFKCGSARYASFLGTTIYCLAIISTKWTIDYGYYFVLVSFGILPGIGCGMAWTPAVINVFGWYPSNKGLTSGFIMAGYGIGAFFFNYIITLIVNPDNLTPNGTCFEQEEVLARVPNLFLKLGLIYLILEMIACSLLFTPPPEPEEIQKMVEGRDKKDLNINQNHIEHYQDDELDRPLLADEFGERELDKDRFPWSMLLSKQFMVLFVTTALSAQAGVFLSSMQKQYGQTYIKDDHYLSLIGSLSSLAISVGKIFWGCAIDKLSYVHCFSLLTMIMSTTVLLLPCEFILKNEYAFAACILLASTSMIGYSVILNVKCYKSFGQRHATLMTGLIWIASTFNIPASLLIGHLYKDYDRYAPCFLLGSFTLLSEVILILYICYNKKKSWKCR